VRFDSGTCLPGDKEDIARQVNVPLRVEVQDRRDAVVIKANLDTGYVASISPHYRSDACAGVGLSFTRRVSIPRPIGNRALINGGFYYQAAPKLLLPSLIKKKHQLWSHRIDLLRYMGINRKGHRLKPGETP
jgi:hypothetical protein